VAARPYLISIEAIKVTRASGVGHLHFAAQSDRPLANEKNDEAMSPDKAGDARVDADDMLNHAPALRAYLRRRVRNPADVDDYVQEVYAKVLKAAPAEKIETMRGFLFRVASNLLADRFRRDQTRMRESHVTLDSTPGLTDGRPGPERELRARQRLRALSDALKSVDPIARSIFLLVRVDGLSHREAGERFGIEAKQASRQVDRVLAYLARTLAGELDE
jgi:RNA polymerase sigma factor (sigma-70 family)